MKIRQVLVLRHDAGELAQGLRHQARVQAHVAVAHLAIELRLGNQRGDGIDHDDVDRAGSHQRAGDLERLFAAVGLRHQQVVHVHAQVARIRRIERVLGIDEGRASPPSFCASAITCSAMVVLPDDSGPKTSTTRPRGMPPTPSAASIEIDPVEITETGTTLRRSQPEDGSFAELLFQLDQGLVNDLAAFTFFHALGVEARRGFLSGKTLSPRKAQRHGRRTLARRGCGGRRPACLAACGGSTFIAGAGSPFTGSALTKPSDLRTSVFELLANIVVVLEELLGVLASLADALALVAEPRAALFDHVLSHAEIDQVAFLAKCLRRR